MLLTLFEENPKAILDFIGKVSPKDLTIKNDTKSNPIADAIDRHTELQRTNIEAQIKIAGLSGKALKEMMNLMKKATDNNGEDWKNTDGYDDKDSDII